MSSRWKFCIDWQVPSVRKNEARSCVAMDTNRAYYEVAEALNYQTRVKINRTIYVVFHGVLHVQYNFLQCYNEPL